MASNPIFVEWDPAIDRDLAVIVPNRLRISNSLIFSGDPGVDHPFFVIVPEFLESVETLEYMGWDKNKAIEMWTKWLAEKQYESEEMNGTNFEVGFFEYVMDQITEKYKPEEVYQDWEVEMRRWGIGKELREAILDPAHENIRRTEALYFWVLDTMQIRCEILWRLQRESKARIREYLSPNGIANTGQSSASTVPVTSSTDSGNLLLYKAITNDRLCGPYDKPGEIRLERLSNDHAPSDVRKHNGSVMCLTPSLQVAKHHQRYISRRTGAPGLVVGVSIPKSFVDALPPFVLSYGDVWKRLVFSSRRRLEQDGNFRRFYREFPLIIAPISALGNLNSFDQMSARRVLYVEGPEALQYNFQGDDVLDELEEHSELRNIT